MTLQEKFDSIMNSIESLVGVGEEDIPNAVAREAGLNLRQLADSFQFMTDMTLIKYIRRRRLVHALDTRIAPKWLDVDKTNVKATVTVLPTREDVDFPFEEHLIVELYSK
jgi:ribosomal protein S4